MKHLTPYEEGFNVRLQNPEFRKIWEAGAARRAVISALMGERIKQKYLKKNWQKRQG